MHRIALIAAFVAVSAGAVWADYDLSIAVRTYLGEDGGVPIWHESTRTPEGNPNGSDGTMHYEDEWASHTGYWWCRWNIDAKADPFVTANITFRNTMPTPQIYTVIVTQPIFPPVVPSSLIGGSTGGSLTDTNSNGAGFVKTVFGAPLYMGRLDANGVLPIYPDPTAFNITFAGQTVTIPAQNPGLPGPTIPSIAANSSISIMHQFELSPGDSVGFTSYFVVVPEPAAAILLGLGGLALLRRRR